MLHKIIKSLLYLTVFLTPLFWPARDGLLIALVSIIVFFWLVKTWRERKIEIKRTPLDYPLLAFLAVYFLSAYFSLSRYTSIFSFLLILCLSILYWLSVWNLERKEIGRLLKLVVFSGFLSAVLFLLNALAPSLPYLTNPLGSLSLLSSWLALLVPLALYLALKSKKGLGRFLGLMAIVFFIVIISLVNFKASWIILGVAGFVGLVLLMTRKDDYRNWSIVPMFILTLVIMWQFFSLSPIYRLQLPAEVSLGREASFLIAKNTVHSGVKEALIGSGPSTFQFDFSRFRSRDFNQNPLWQIRFSQGYNQLFEFWATTGYLGSLLFILLLGLVLVISFGDGTSRLLLPIWISFLALGWYGVFSIPVWLLFFILLAFSLPEKTKKAVSFSLNKSLGFSLASSSGFVLGVVAVVLLFGFLTKVYLADYYFREGSFAKAAEMNPAQAAYHMVLAQDSVREAKELANEITGASGSETEKEAKRAEIRNLLALAINRSHEAINRAPFDSIIWQARGGIFREVRGFSSPEDKFAREANDWIVKSLDQAIRLESNNPSLHLDLGLAYESRGETEKALEEVKKSVDLKADLAVSRYELGRLYYNQQEDDLAIEQLEKAVALNSNYSNALYSLALTYERAGRRKDALVLLTRVRELNPDNEFLEEEIKKFQTPSKEEAG